MLFNSLSFAIFLPVVYLLYWFIHGRSLRFQNFLLLVASYIFYGWWDWRFLTLIIISSLTDYAAGIGIAESKEENRRKTLLAISIVVNLGTLAFFKYYGFFIDSLAEALRSIGFQPSIRTLQVILPVGISFYTFQTLSYTIDIYRQQMTPTRNIVAFFSYVSFFPQLVAGPIERARNLLPQFLKERNFDLDAAKNGARQIMWGFFKKVVVADNLAPYVDRIYGNYDEYSGLILMLGTFYFAIQIYCDFSGYSDIAIGTARLFGFQLMPNFAFPYFSRNIGEFWRRWHISLSTWFRDYLYIPLGGSRVSSKRRHLTNLIITFTISGLWHGANWTFVIWGFLHGIFFLPLVLSQSRRRYSDTVAAGRILPTLRELTQITTTFSLTLLAWIFFRSDTVSDALAFSARIFSTNWLTPPKFVGGLPYVALLLGVEWLQRQKLHALQIDHLPRWERWAIYYATAAGIALFANTGEIPFIYFQF